MKILTDQELRSGDDGRLQDLAVFKHGNTLVYRAGFNNYPYRSTIITKEQYERYKKLCTPVHECSTHPNYMIEFWECSRFDNGLPKWFNKLF